MKVKGKLYSHRNGYHYYELKHSATSLYDMQLDIRAGYSASYDFAKGLAEKFAIKHNMTIEWEGE